jgi:hypothetical protein
MTTMAVAVILAAALGMPFAAAILVGAASRHEDRECTLAGPAPGRAAAAARRIVAFHSDPADWVSAAGPRRPRPAGPRWQPGDSRVPRAAPARPVPAWPQGPAGRGHRGHGEMARPCLPPSPARCDTQLPGRCPMTRQQSPDPEPGL